jgi:hypothetical protein
METFREAMIFGKSGNTGYKITFTFFSRKGLILPSCLEVIKMTLMYQVVQETRLLGLQFDDKDNGTGSCLSEEVYTE